MYRAAMRSIFSELLRQGRLVVVDELSLPEVRTKALRSQLAEMGFDKGTIITKDVDANLFLSARNMPHVYVAEAKSLNPVQLVHSDKVIMTAEALKAVEEGLA
jgi:large subunit ribosomal protein L4